MSDTNKKTLNSYPYYNRKDITSLKIPPHSVEAEQAVIGGILLDNSGWHKIYHIISEKDFYRIHHGVLFSEIGKLISKGKSCDVITLIDLLKSNGTLEESGGTAYIFELAKNTPSASNIIAYSQIVRDKSVLRYALSYASDMSNDIFNLNGKTPSSVILKTQKLLSEIHDRININEQKLISFQEDILNFVQKTELKRLPGYESPFIKTGLKDLDNLIGGIKRKEMTVIAARPSMGKTSLVMNIALNICTSNKLKCLIFSLEMSRESLTQRIICSESRVDMTELNSGKITDEDHRKLEEVSNRIFSVNPDIYIDESGSLSTDDMYSRIKNHNYTYGCLDIVIIDYLQLMKVTYIKDNKVREVTEISRFLKQLSVEFNCCVLAVAQLNRGCETRNDKRPVMSDLRDSGAVEQDADMIMLIYRDEVYNKSSFDKGTAEIIVAKNRNGPIGKIHLQFEPKFCSFKNLKRKYDD